MWDYAAISRTQTGLAHAILTLQPRRQAWKGNVFAQALSTLPSGTPFSLPTDLDEAWIRAWGELHNLYDIAWLILNTAAFRTESRGGHFREDYPQNHEQWRVHTLVRGNQWEKSDPVG
jgi:L-aspartate oxidase